MITDKMLYFSEKQALAAGNSESVLDTGMPDPGAGRDLDLFVQVEGAAAADLTITLQGADDAAFTTPVSIASYTVPAAEAQAGGRVIRNRLPHKCRRFLRLAYAGTSGGTVTAGLVKDS